MDRLLQYLQNMKLTEWLGVGGFVLGFGNLLVNLRASSRAAEKHGWEKEKQEREEEERRRKERDGHVWQGKMAMFCQELQRHLATQPSVMIEDPEEQAYVEVGMNQGFPFEVERRAPGKPIRVSLRR